MIHNSVGFPNTAYIPIGTKCGNFGSLPAFHQTHQAKTCQGKFQLLAQIVASPTWCQSLPSFTIIVAYSKHVLRWMRWEFKLFSLLLPRYTRVLVHPIIVLAIQFFTIKSFLTRSLLAPSSALLHLQLRNNSFMSSPDQLTFLGSCTKVLVLALFNL